MIKTVLELAPLTASNVVLNSRIDFKLKEEVEPMDGGPLHVCWNGLRWSKAMDTPAFGQDSFEWLSSVISKGLADSNFPLMLQTINRGRLTEAMASSIFNALTGPFALLSTLEDDIVSRGDFKRLYTDMASRGFAYSFYTLHCIDTNGCTFDARGWFMLIKVEPSMLRPRVFRDESSLEVRVDKEPCDTITMFDPTWWQGTSDGMFGDAWRAKDP